MKGKEKMKPNCGKVKNAILENKKRIIIVLAMILTIITILTMTIYQNDRSGQNTMNPELARAMTYLQVQEGEEAVEGTENVKFDAFFLRDINNDGYAESIRGTCKEIGKEDTLYMELNVQTAGYLKDAKITVEGKNFYLQTTLPKDQELLDNYIGNNIKEIKFNQLNNGTQKMLTGIVRSGDYSYNSSKASAIGNNINNYSQINNVTLTGTYVDENGQELSITKTVNFNIDWYGTAKARIYSTSQNQNIENAINEEEQTINLGFTVYTEETEQILNIKTNHVEGEIPDLNGYAPIEVVYTGTNATFNYDVETRKFTLDRTAQVEEDGKIIGGVSRSNSYSLKAIYPLEAYQTLGTESVQLRVPVKTYYEAYNNPNSEFKNPYKSNTPQATILITYQKPATQTHSTSFEIQVGKYIYHPSYRYVISKQKPLRIYNGESEQEKDDTYTVMWKGYVGTNAKLDGMMMKETPNDQSQITDQFIKTDTTLEGMDEVVSNVGIYFSGADALLGEEGWIKVYDEETGDLLETFTKDMWNRYSSSNPYQYTIPVKHIRVETSELIRNETSLYVYNIKELDDEKITTKYQKEQFDQLQYIKSTLVGYMAGEQIAIKSHQANYEAPISVATIAIANNTISTQGTEKNNKITIQTQTSSSNNEVEWKNGIFLVKLPDEIIDVKLNSVEINNSKVNLESYEVVEQEGKKFIKIVTKNEVAQTYKITLDVDLSADPRIATTTRTIELYATNENGSDYYEKGQDIYDVNNNLNTEEMVNHSTTSISMVSPNSLLTNQTASNYDQKQSMVIAPQVADIRPSYAVVDQEQEEKLATISVQIKNNYASTISEIKLLGKIPFKGNTYVINGNDLGSTFTTKMTNTGITLPEELANVATIHYSENETPDRDLSKEANGWKTAEQVENWDTIKTFLIDLGNYVMPTGKEFIFNYMVKIPNGLEFNQVAYSHHGVYFSLDTENGKYRTQTEPNKLGFRIAEKYELVLQKYQTGKEKLVPGATYSFKEIVQNEDGTETEGETKTGVTNAEGSLKITNLYAKKVYEIKEIKTPDDYELNEDVIRFIGHVDEQGNLSIEKQQGNSKGEIEVIKQEGENYQTFIKVEDEVKASLKITKKEQGSEIKIPYVRYKLTGYGLPESGKNISTNINGETTLKGLSVNQEYTLQEVKALGYYLANPIKFKIVNKEGNYAIETIEGEIANQNTVEENGIPTINVNLEDEKIPTYDLEITKIKKTTETTTSDDQLMAKAEGNLAPTDVTYLEGAKFRLYKGNEQIGEYITDHTGKIKITGLYQYATEKNIDQTYTLKEVLAPEGYAKVKDITFKVEEVEGQLKFQEAEQEGATKKAYTAEGNTIKLMIEDSPSFRLLKKDAETKLPIANVKFAIYNVEEGETPAKNSKGEIIGTKESINGKEYYTITTDENGVITADLTEGLYKAVEIQAPDQYVIENSAHYFGIGASREGRKSVEVEWAKGIGGDSLDEISSVIQTADGGIVVGGYFTSKTIDLGNGTTLNNVGYNDGMIIKYNAEGEIQWAKSIGGDYHDYIKSVAETADGGIVIGGYFYSRTIDLGNGITLNNQGNADGMIIKYNADGEIEWAKSIGGSSNDNINSVTETEDEGIIVGGYFSSNIDLGNGITLNNQSNADGMIIKYNAKGEVEWAKNIGGNFYDYISSVSETTDGGIIVGGYFNSSTIDLGNGISINNSNNGKDGKDDGMVIKYNAKSEVEWAKSIGGSSDDRINSVIETKDGGIIVGGHFKSSIIDLGDGIGLSSKGYDDGMIIKYSAEGETQWAKGIGGNSYDYINSVIETADGGIIAGGYFRNTINLENRIGLSSEGTYAGMIIKYSAEGETQWAKSIGGASHDYIKSVAETADGGIIVGGYFYSSTIDLGNGVTLTNNGSTSYSDGMIIKYKPIEVSEVVINQAKGIGGMSQDIINSVAETADGGIVIGGYFNSKTIDLGNEMSLNNNGRDDGMVIKYNAEGKIEWAKSIGGTGDDQITSVAETTDGGIIVGGHFKSSIIDLGDGVKLTSKMFDDGMIIKYNAEGKIEWAKSIGGTGNDQITSVAETEDGGIIVGGYFDSSTIDLGNGVTLTNNGSTSYSDGMVIKYNVEGKIEWANSIGGSSNEKINSVTTTENGGIVAGGHFTSSTIDLGNGISLKNNESDGSDDGMLIKYNAEGKVEWAKNIGGGLYDYIHSVKETTDGGIVAGGNFKSSTIDLGNGISLNNESNGSDDGMIIKYNVEGEVEWAKNIGGNSYDYIQSVTEVKDGGIVAGGNFKSSTIDLGNGTSLNNNGSNDGMVIKYNAKGEAEWAKSTGGSLYDSINTVAETTDGGIVVGGEFKSSIINLENGENLTNKSSDTSRSDGMLIKIKEEMGVPEAQELVVENETKEFRITTDVKEIDGVKGGSISGEDYAPYEKVKYKENSNKEIVMTPEENYEIIAITVNGEEYKFEANEDGTYTMPQFETITEDKHIEVTYSLKDNKITIHKIDRKTKQPLEGATFKLDQIEERTNPENVIGELTANGQQYTIANKENEIVDVVGALTTEDMEQPHFVEENGTYVPTNSKTYQTTHVEGATSGLHSTTAKSYLPIDLTEKEGNYVIVVNASISSESADKGYARITETTTPPTSTTGQIMQISGTVAEKDYTSIALAGGKTYYLHLGYSKDQSVDTKDDQIVFNSIKVYGADVSTYNFIQSEGKYESNNQGQDNTVANSYLPIDLTKSTGKYNLTVNAQVSSQSSDYGYATVTENTTRPTYSTSTGRFIYISGTTGENATAKDYTTVLQGGKMYYLHLGYYKNGTISEGDDKFTVNSIKITLNDSELYHTEVTTNSDGQAIAQIPFGKYTITETKAPEGYELNETPMEVEFRADENHEFTLENSEKAKVVVHHYKKGTTEKLAEDDRLEGKIGTNYTTTPHLDIPKYELEKDKEGSYILPENAVGEYESGTIEVIYYYVEKEIPLTVHHYIEGTTMPVPLKDGTQAQDESLKGRKGENYQTQEIQEELLSEQYELVETPENATGTYEENEITVIYYYKKVKREVILTKHDETGAMPLAGAEFVVAPKGEEIDKTSTYVTNSQGKIQQILEVGEYVATEITAPEGYQLPENAETEFVITKQTDQIELNITNKKKQGTVVVHHYLEGTTEKVPAKEEGKVVEDEVKTGDLGDIYATKESEEVSRDYQLIEVVGNTSGEYKEEQQEVIYYYINIPQILGSKIEKTTDIQKITDKNQTIDYTINYQTTIDRYKGKATGIIIDTLPYEIDEEKSNLANGHYDPDNKTITWIEPIENINTFENGIKEIVISKTINIVYRNLDVTQEIVANTATGTIKIERPEKEETIETTKEIPTEYVKNITVNKIWEDNPIQAIRRPEKIIIQLKKQDEILQIYELNTATENTHTFENLPKYDSDGNEINYVIEEAEKAEGDLKFYTKQINGTTITNTFIRPLETITIEVNKKWIDQNDIYGKRPENIVLQVKAGEEVIQEKAVGEKEDWKWNFSNLPEYDENGQEIIYTVEEREVGEDELFYYTKQISEITNQEQDDKKQATITNTMTKTPGFIEIRYVDLHTKLEIEDRKEKEGIIGENFDVTEDKKDIPGYTLVQEPEEKTGTYTEESQVKTYYYAKNSKVIVKYLERGTNKVLTQEPQYEIKGYEGLRYTTEKKQIEGYTFVESTNNTSGIMEIEPIEVIYYYEPNAEVVVKYLEKDNTPDDNTDNKVLIPQQTINGYVGKDYKTEEKEITGFTLVETTENTEGQMTKEPIEVIYYYAKNTKVIVKYLEKDNTPENDRDNKVLATEETIDGYVGKTYTTTQKAITNYVLVENTNNTTGIMTEETIEVIYYYAQETKATVQHIDRETGKILKQESKNGKVGDLFETHAENFSGYVLVKEPEQPNVTMTKEEQIVKYYYAKISAGVIEKHIDDITGELLASETHNGNEGDEYHISSKEFAGYDLVTSKLPSNAEGKMKQEAIEVKYYYSRRASVRVEHIDQETGSKLAEDEVQNGHENDNYTTQAKEFKDYILVETPKNATGKMTITQNEDGTYTTEIVVTYYYVKQAGGVLEKHVDIQTNKVLAEQEHKGKIGDAYDIQAKVFEGYELVKEKLPTNSQGKMTAEKVEVIYYYEKLGKVKVEYLDKQTGEKLDEEEIKGKVGDNYQTEEKEFDNYDLVEVPSNNKGEIKEKETIVKYYYQRKAEVEVQYLEKDSNYPLSQNEEIKGYVGDKYETEQKEIAYYKFVESTTNTKGNMTKDKITVTYYYQKQIFNLSVDKWVSKVSVNGITSGAKDYNTRDELYKLDIHRKKAGNADVRITYTIKISNKGEVEGNVGRITELIPAGYSFYQEDNNIRWEEAGGILITDALKEETIYPDQNKEIEIVLRWNPGESNFGQKENTVVISNLDNPAGYQDIDKEDNTAKSEMLLTVATGLDRNDRIVIVRVIALLLVISAGWIMLYKKTHNR